MKKKFKIKINSVIFAIMMLIVILFWSFLLYANILPIKYLLLVIFVSLIWLVIIWIIFFFKNKHHSKKRSIIGYIISFFLLIVISFVFFYLNSTLNFIGGFGSNKYKEENYLVIVLNDSPYNTIDDLKNKNIGYVKNDLNKINDALNILNDKISIDNKEYEQYDDLFNDLFSKKISSLLIEESYLTVLEENNDYADKIKSIFTIQVKTEITNVDKNVNVTNTPFTIYLSGIDTYGTIASVSRSDVNMIVTINPKTKQVLLVSIPRDYYVQLHGTSGYKDKLTHAGLYGIDTSIESLEDLLNIDVNYYYRVNFSTLQNIVDAIGGVDAYSKYSFTSSAASGGTYKFNKGYNHLNGKQALSFSRERHNLPSAAGGDRGRGENQQAVIDGIIRKATSASILTKYSKLLETLKNQFQTNMNDDDIVKLIKMQLNDMSSWNITAYSLNGSNAEEYTYSYPHKKLYVMKPSEDTVTEATALINKVISGEKLDGSYDQSASNIKNPTTVNETPSNTTPKEETKTYTKPVITIKGSKSINVLLGSEYIDAGATAKDDIDGDITSKVKSTGKVDTTKEGTYTIKYDVTNGGNLSAETVTRTVNVVKEGLTLIGNSEITLKIGDTYSDKGVKAYDEKGNKLEVIITVNDEEVKSINIDTTKEGTYIIKYSVNDSLIGSNFIKRTINVIKDTASEEDPTDIIGGLD